MVFKTLPIEFDAYGRAHLRDEDAESPYIFEDESRMRRSQNRQRALEKLVENPQVWNCTIDPVTRLSGNLALHAVIDFEQGRVLDAQVENPQGYGIETILKGRQPSDAVQIAARVRGAAGASHAIAASLALEMAGGITPPPLAIICRNLGSCGEVISETIRHLFINSGPDYSEELIHRTTPSLWKKAQRTAAEGLKVHGLETVADLMRGLNPMSGHLYLEALQMARLANEVATLVFGRKPHASTLFPGGIGIEANRETFNQILGRVNSLLDYAKKAAAIWDEIVEFFYAAEPRYRRVGELPGNLISVGAWDHPEAYDASYANSNHWGEKRYSPPGVIINNVPRTSRLSDVNIGIEQFIEHSFFQPWNRQRFQTDPLSGPISPWHPWNKETIPMPARLDLREKYSWNTAPRWDREAMETGPIARLWIAAAMGRNNCEFIAGDRRGLEIDIPRGQRPASRLHWLIPERPNTLERNRARAYQLAYAGMVAYANLLNAFDCLRRGETHMSKRFLLPEKSIGVGFWEGSAGSITHHVVVRNHNIGNYQVASPSDWMGSPRDMNGVPGSCEAAVMNTLLLEESSGREDFTAIDILRTIRSFDP